MADTNTGAALPAPVLSFPAILRNPGLKDRYAHLRGTSLASSGQELPAQIRAKKIQRDQNEGKRWVRRKDNARFVGNPHVVTATRNDYILPTPSNRSTFPEPLPSYLPRTVKVPVATLPARDPVSANAGRFSLSLKGMRKELRRAGGRAEALVQDVEAEMVEWLKGGTMLRPDESNAAGLAALQVNLDGGRAIGSTGTITEVSRTPLQLVWSVADDAFARYVVHCCARYHEVVSFSKGNASERLTYLLRPNVQKPDYKVATTLDTPPITDLDYSSQLESTDIDSDFVSDRDLTDSDIEEQSGNPRTANTTTSISGNLDSIQEASLPASPLIATQTIDGVPVPVLREEDEWSVLSGDVDAYGDESSSEAGQDLADSIASLNLVGKDSVHQIHPVINESAEYQDHEDPDKTLNQDAVVELVQEIRAEEGKEHSPIRIPHHHQTSSHFSGRRWERSTSSPSRSPVRARRFASAKKKRQAARIRRAAVGNTISFYDYIYST